MFRCPACHNNRSFSITETIRQRVTICCRDDGSYEEEYVERLSTIDWEALTCNECDTVWSEHELRQAFAAQRD